MRFAFNKSELAKITEQRNGYLVIAAGLLVLCFILAVVVINLIGREKIVIVPPVIHQSFWVSNSEVSPEYLTEMTAFLTYLRFNLTPDNLEHQQDTLLHYTDPSFYGLMKNQLVSEKERIIRDHLSSAFYPVNTQVDAKRLKVTITGDLHTYLGKEQLPNHVVCYEITYRYDHGKLLVKSFTEVKSEKEGGKNV